jgi:ABC-type transporter Mla subunit MlaD
MDEHVLAEARRRIDEARAGDPLRRFDAALERSRAELESVAAAAARLEESLPDRIGDAVREGIARDVAPVARSLAEIRGLLNQALRRLERLEQEVLAERSARIDDLALLVDLVSSGWQGVDARLRHLEELGGATIVPLRSESVEPVSALAS